MPITIYILLIVIFLIAIRNVISLIMPIWGIMLLGAALVLVLKQITLSHAITAINPDIMLYLFGAFVISEAAEASGYLAQVTDRLFNYANTGKQALFIIIFLLGLSTAVLMNDTLAIVGTPIILQLCKAHKTMEKPLLLALAYAITIGSVLSPLGNPQNLLIAVEGGMAAPFASFIKLLTIPTLINLLLTYFIIYGLYRKTLNIAIEKPAVGPLPDPQTAFLVKISLVLMLILIAIKILSDALHIFTNMQFSFITIISALPILLFSNKRISIMKNLDWGTLLFFVGTFILMQSVWDSNFFQMIMQHAHAFIKHSATILLSSVVLSQFISNVPLVTLYLPLLKQHAASEQHLLALAAGSTIAGNLSVLGAASNIIIMQNAEKRGRMAFSYFDFIKLGLPLTLINVLVYALFI